MFRVLLIDDTPIYLTIVRAVLENNLRGIPHEIVEADDGLPGIKHYKDAIASGQPFNLVVTDYVMNHSAS